MQGKYGRKMGPVESHRSTLNTFRAGVRVVDLAQAGRGLQAMKDLMAAPTPVENGEENFDMIACLRSLKCQALVQRGNRRSCWRRTDRPVRWGRCRVLGEEVVGAPSGDAPKERTEPET